MIEYRISNIEQGISKWYPLRKFFPSQFLIRHSLFDIQTKAYTFKPPFYSSLSMLFFVFIPLTLTAQLSEEEIKADLLEVEEELLIEVNSYRKDNNMNTLTRDEVLDEIAHVHSQNMADGRTRFGHSGAKERTNAVKSFTEPPYSVGENLYMTTYPYHIAANTVYGWVRSPGHKVNLDGDFQFTGISAVRNRSGETYITMIYVGKP